MRGDLQIMCNFAMVNFMESDKKRDQVMGRTNIKRVEKN